MGLTAIYILKDPRTLEIRYVGKSVNPEKRFTKHLYYAKSSSRKTYVYAWIKQLLNEGFTPIQEIIEWTDNWVEREQYWINYYKNNHPLTNLAEGGKGSVGYKHTEEWKKLLSERMKGNTIMVGLKHSKETRLKMSKSNNSLRTSYPIIQYDKDMNFIKEWQNIKEAADYYNIYRTVIINNISGWSKKTKFRNMEEKIIN